MFQEIQSQFNEVIAYSQEMDLVNSDDLFKRWQEAKRDIIEAWGGQLIVEWPTPVSFELDSEDKQQRIHDFADMVRWNYFEPILADFIIEQKEGFFSNRVVQDHVHKGITIKKGTKLLRTFKHFIPDEQKLNDIQMAASMIIQEDKIEGTLCLSVHPLDFLSSSENTHNWRSCHSLNGDYRAGNLSYMVDKSTIMCYLKSNKNEILPNFPESVPWNSKKWRVLLFLSDNWDMIFAGRQYPFICDFGLNFVTQRMLPVFHLPFFSEWHDEKMEQFNFNNGECQHLKDKYLPVGNELKPLSEIIIDEPGSLNFNDLLRSTCYEAKYAYRVDTRKTYIVPWGKLDKIFTTKSNAQFHIGGFVKCLRCGDQKISMSELMMCTDCELKYGNSDSGEFCFCVHCGEKILTDDAYIEEYSGDCLCPDCAADLTVACDYCGARVYIDNSLYDEEFDGVYCSDYCLERGNHAASLRVEN